MRKDREGEANEIVETFESGQPQRVLVNSHYDCPVCGCWMFVHTEAKQSRRRTGDLYWAYDGDPVICGRCGARGSVSVDGDSDADVIIGIAYDAGREDGKDREGERPTGRVPDLNAAIAQATASACEAAVRAEPARSTEPNLNPGGVAEARPDGPGLISSESGRREFESRSGEGGAAAPPAIPVESQRPAADDEDRDAEAVGGIEPTVSRDLWRFLDEWHRDPCEQNADHLHLAVQTLIEGDRQVVREPASGGESGRRQGRLDALAAIRDMRPRLHGLPDDLTREDQIVSEVFGEVITRLEELTKEPPEAEATPPESPGAVVLLETGAPDGQPRRPHREVSETGGCDPRGQM